MRIVDLSMTVEEWDSTPFAPEDAYFKLRLSFAITSSDSFADLRE
jgi:hypothetical protein